MLRARVAAVFVAVVLLAACTTQEFTPTPSAVGRPAYDGQVAVLQKLPGGDYEVLGTVIVTGRAYATEQSLLETLVEEAAKYGANTVVMQGKPIEVQTTYELQMRLAGTLLWRQ